MSDGGDLRDEVEALEPEASPQGDPRGRVFALGRRLERLVRSGAALFDSAGVRFVEVLLERARTLGGGAGWRLAHRAAERLDALEAAQALAREAARVALEALSTASTSRHVDVSRAFEAGDYDWARRDAQRALRELRRPTRQPDGSWLRRVVERATARPVSLPEDVARGLAHLDPKAPDLVARRSAQAVGGAVSLALFREAAGAARAQFIVARSLDALPEQVGPYNPQLIAARALAALSELSPLYLRSYLARLEDLSRLEAVFAPVVAPVAAAPAQAAKAGAKVPRRGVKKGPSGTSKEASAQQDTGGSPVAPGKVAKAKAKAKAKANRKSRRVLKTLPKSPLEASGPTSKKRRGKASPVAPAASSPAVPARSKKAGPTSTQGPPRARKASSVKASKKAPG